MKTPAGYRKRIEHFNEPGHCRELTFSCYRSLPLLTDDAWREMFSRSIDRAMVGHGFSLIAFVFMPEHVHLLVHPNNGTADVPGLLYAIKRPYSYHIKQVLLQSGSPLLQQLTVQERPDKTVFRYWQEGPGYDRNLSSTKAVRESIDYLHMNPVRRKLVAEPLEWKWSSCRFYAADGQHCDPALPKVQGLPAEFWDGT